MDNDKLNESQMLIQELVDHLEYCGWGDKWERECSEDLQIKVKEYMDREKLN